MCSYGEAHERKNGAKPYKTSKAFENRIGALVFSYRDQGSARDIDRVRTIHRASAFTVKYCEHNILDLIAEKVERRGPVTIVAVFRGRLSIRHFSRRKCSIRFI